MAGIHDRMPVIVPEASWAAWLDPTPREPGELRALLEPRDDVELAAYAVPPLVNNVRNNGPELIAHAPSGEQQLPLALGQGAGASASPPTVATADRNAWAGSTPWSSPAA